MTEHECARCGVVILPGAPKVIGPLGESYSGPNEWFHPGCWAAERRALGYA